MSRYRLFRLALFFCLAAPACRLEAQTIWKGESGEYAIEWSTANLKVTRADGAQSVFDAAAEAKTAWSGFLRNAKGAPMEAEFTYSLLSAIGSSLSLEEGVYCECGGAHPTAVKRIRAIDLSRKTSGPALPASLGSIFPERDVFTALMADSIVGKALGTDDKPDSLKGLLAALQDETAKDKDCEFEFPRSLMSSFAVYDAQAGSVSIRLGLPSADQACRGAMIQLNLALPAPAALRTVLLNAKQRRSGLLMVDSPQNGGSVVTSFRFSQKGRGR